MRDRAGPVNRGQKKLKTFKKHLFFLAVFRVWTYEGMSLVVCVHVAPDFFPKGRKRMPYY